ncbi:hypothetical protein [Chitinophaga japonensis]|uniref:YD repeat-containing protein n=2 Tax=Chitinophaga japonensis TaxID=104662 RepID=A0A562T5Q2_CHIJA|nr:hypothetical protein [Chitinophaga japonensis]TWI88867.1 hypothetical protein LX66_2954 [Chitinophaga japonensis]
MIKKILSGIVLVTALGTGNGAFSQQAGANCTCTCLKPMFDYLIASHHLFIGADDHTTLSNIIQEARAAGYNVDYRRCALLYRNINKPFYAVTTDSVSALYKARIGDCSVALSSVSGAALALYNLQSKTCGSDVTVAYTNASSGGATIAELKVDSCYTCTVETSQLCYSAITDSPVNPYLYGIAGNWRPAISYVYYASRTETDPVQGTDIRRNGTFNGFAPFWAFQPDKMAPQYNEAKWVWNTATTLFNQKGFEIENKDPLGRYNAGLYGYGNTLPVAVIQNSRYRESAFEGFEDYDFDIGVCDTTCASGRSFDFSGYAHSIDGTQHHTGKYSIRVVNDSTVGISASLVTEDNNNFQLTVTKGAPICDQGGDGLKDIRANASTIIPPFSPLAGKTVLISAWVKETVDCTVPTYTGSQIGIVVKQGASEIGVIARPFGNIIEGWQRIEQVVSLPADATLLSIYLQALGSNTVYFDDIRVHPYNANMKSFVYNPLNLRLMAELDENNYATFYEYDDDGTLVRLKKETERGIKTIKETRTALVKE